MRSPDVNLGAIASEQRVRQGQGWVREKNLQVCQVCGDGHCYVVQGA